MAGEVRIGGSQASVNLQGSDTITSDQTFTFPDTGGKLLTNAAGSNTGTDGTAGQGQVVGYQQGVWTPFAESATDGAQSGITAYNQQMGNFTRIGNLITSHFYLQAATDTWSYKPGTSSLSLFYIGGLPYPVSSTAPFTIGAGVIAYLNGNNFANADGQTLPFRCYPGNPARVTFVYSNVTLGYDTQCNYDMIFGKLSSGIQGSVSYVTDNTDWKPATGAAVQNSPEFYAVQDEHGAAWAAYSNPAATEN